MARSSKRKTGAARRNEAAVRLMLVGAAFATGPWLASQALISKAPLPLSWIGWLMLAIGAGMLWLQRREHRIDPPAPPRQVPARDADFHCAS